MAVSWKESVEYASQHLDKTMGPFRVMFQVLFLPLCLIKQVRTRYKSEKFRWMEAISWRKEAMPLDRINNMIQIVLNHFNETKWVGT